MPTRRSTADKLKKPLLYLLVFLFLLSGTLYYYVKGETDAPGFSDWVDEYIPDGMEVHFLDVGQGSSTLLLCGESAVLVDGGEYENGFDIVSYLKHHGVEKLDLLVATHNHSDHIGGLIVVLQKMTVNEVLLNGSTAETTDTQSENEFTSRLLFNGAIATTAEAEMVYEFSGMQISVLQANNDSADENENSIVLRADFENTSVLLTGDIGNETENELINIGVNLDCDILQAAHHGSNHSNSADFIVQTSPSIAVISCGENNIYNHPGEDSLHRLRQANTAVYRTDVMGTIVFACNDNNIKIISDGKEE